MKESHRQLSHESCKPWLIIMWGSRRHDWRAGVAYMCVRGRRQTTAVVVLAVIPNSSLSSVFAHSTGPVRSVHWPSDLDVPTTSWSAPWSSDPYFPVHFGTNTPWASRSTLSSGMGVHAVPGPRPFPIPVYTPTASEPSPLPSRESSPYECRMPFRFSCGEQARGLREGRAEGCGVLLEWL
jgi:hypothetical protein